MHGMTPTKDIKALRKQKERRKSFRADLIRRVKYVTSGFASIECFTLNISEGGLCLLLGEELCPGITIRAEFFLPGKNPRAVKASAVVVWQKDYLTGVKFIF
jgi:c-di-GMP-binding flagellar brake protein YcgR